jgi:predicted amidohydrolase YtcJ
LKEEADLGTIEIGKLGDVVVLSDDFFDSAKVTDEKIKRIESELTIVDGRVVYRKQ